MLHQLAISSKDPLWKRLGEKALLQAVSTLVEEGIKATVELWKTRHMKEMDIEFEERKKARREEAGDSEKDSEKD